VSREERAIVHPRTRVLLSESVVQQVARAAQTNFVDWLAATLFKGATYVHKMRHHAKPTSNTNSP